MEYVHNVHRMFIGIGIWKTRNAWRLSWSRYETFIYLFEFKVFRHEERERDTHNFFLCWLFHLTPTTCGTPPQTTSLASASFGNRLASSKPQISTKSFFSNPKILSPSIPGITSFTSPVIFPIWGFYCDICDCHILPARAWTLALNVCT